MIDRNQYADRNTFICSYIGTIGMAQGLDVILRAARMLKRTQDRHILFLLVGDGACKDALEQMVEDEKFSMIRFVGLVPKETIPEYIAISDASLVHLKNNPLFATVIPSKMFELMAMNVPIIMGVKGEARNIVLDARAGEAMEPENEQDLLKAIDIIRKNDKEHYHGRACIKKYYDRNNLAQNMLDIILSTSKNNRMG
jgi:glycosyltransferase involved in cell wall biosynthesis